MDIIGQYFSEYMLTSLALPKVLCRAELSEDEKSREANRDFSSSTSMFDLIKCTDLGLHLYRSSLICPGLEP